jgi:NAD(P)-dependent dehydrogenase (short-subunit alcohol dehydrogenase family)
MISRLLHCLSIGSVFKRSDSGGRAMAQIKNKDIVVLGASRGVGREIARRARAAGGRVLAVARGEDDLRRLAGEAPEIDILALDAASEDAPHRVFARMIPDVLVVCGGARPPIASIQDMTWSQFAANWECDVKMSLLFCAQALRTPLKPGSVTILISSGAAIGGSPISGGYAGAKRTQMFLAGYAQKESDRLGLGLRFVSLAPMRIMPETALGKAAVEGYSRYLGIPATDFVAGMTDRQSPGDVAEAVMSIASDPTIAKDASYGVSSKGFSPTAPR